MTLTPFILELRAIERGLKDVNLILDQSAGFVVDAVKENIDQGRSAGAFRAVDTRDSPGAAFHPLAKYTIKRRRRDGIVGDKPLLATGEMYRSVGFRRVGRLVRRVGALTGQGKMKMWKMMGSATTGILSTNLKKGIPARNPMGYRSGGADPVKKIFALLKRRFPSKANAAVSIELKF